MQPQMKTEWMRRIERARELQERYPAAAEVLHFYEQVLALQAVIADELSRGNTSTSDQVPFRKQLDLSIPLRHLPRLAALTTARGNAPIFARASPEQMAELVRDRIQAELDREVAPSDEPTAERFFAIALLQPVMEALAQQLPPVESSGSRCPKCDALPLLAVLRPEGEGAKRWLHCSLCLTEWSYRRVLCPWCGETDKDKLPRYSAEECNYVRVEACDTCKRYLKSIDLTVEGHAVPLVDEVALAALDVWAVEHGFKKISPNLLGM